MAKILIASLLALAAECVDSAPRAHLEPQWGSESLRKPQEGPANGFTDRETTGTILVNSSTAPSRKVRAHEVLAYDGEGRLVGVFSIRKSHPRGETVGAFKITVRPDARGQGWGKRLLDRALELGLDVVEGAFVNSYTPSGRKLMKSWLAAKTGVEGWNRERTLRAARHGWDLWNADGEMRIQRFDDPMNVAGDLFAEWDDEAAEAGERKAEAKYGPLGPLDAATYAKAVRESGCPIPLLSSDLKALSVVKRMAAAGDEDALVALALHRGGALA